MLIDLWIKDFAIIDELRVGFEPGFNALTGETGAGKSIIIDALGAVLGERVGSDVVRSGARLARVEATFDVAAVASRPAFQALLADMSLDLEDDALILGREITASGRSSARINGRAATAGMLARFGALLVDIHGQSDHLTLLRTSEQLEILDRYASTAADRAEVARLVRELRELRAKIAEIEAGSRERAQRIDLLQFQVGEIESARLQPGEEEQLLAERQILGNAERLTTAAQSAYTAINGDDEFGASGGMLVQLQQVQHAIADISSVDAQMAGLAERASEVMALVQDVSSEVRAYRDGIEADPARLGWIEDRLETFKGLKRKYGATIEEVISHGQDAAEQLVALTGGEAGVEGLRERERSLLAEIGTVAAKLSSAREEAGRRLARQVEATIAELNMGRSTFDVEIVQTPDPDGVPIRRANGEMELVAVDATGIDRVQFLIATNAGEQLKPLGRVASGGETARLMLALKSTCPWPMRRPSWSLTRSTSA